MEPSCTYAQKLIAAGVKSFKVVAYGASSDDEKTKSKTYEAWSDAQNRGTADEAFNEFLLRPHIHTNTFTLYYVPIGTSAFLRHDFRLSQPHEAPAQQAGIGGITPDFVNQQISAAIAGVDAQWNARLYAMEQERQRKELEAKVKTLEAELNKKNTVDERLARMLGSVSGIFGPIIEESVVTGIGKIVGVQTAQVAAVAGVQPQPAQPQPQPVQKTPPPNANDLQARYERAANALVGILGEEGAVKGLEKLAELDRSMLEGLIAD